MTRCQCYALTGPHRTTKPQNVHIQKAEKSRVASKTWLVRLAFKASDHLGLTGRGCYSNRGKLSSFTQPLQLLVQLVQLLVQIAHFCTHPICLTFSCFDAARAGLVCSEEVCAGRTEGPAPHSPSLPACGCRRPREGRANEVPGDDPFLPSFLRSSSPTPILVCSLQSHLSWGLTMELKLNSSP